MKIFAVTLAIASASIAIGAIPAFAEVDSKIHKLCIEAKDYAGCVQTQISLSKRRKAVNNTSLDSQAVELTPWEKHLNEHPDLKALVEANPALGKKKKEEWKKWRDEDLALEAAQKANPTLFKNKLEELQKIYPSDASATESNSLYPEIDASAVHNNIMSDIKTNACPPGKSLRQKTTFLGLIKLGKICLSDYEVEVLLQGERRNRALGSLKAPRVINCSSNTYGNYTSTSCY